MSHMRNACFLPLLLCAASMAYGGALFCPDTTYVVNPIAGVTGGTVSSCGNANVTVDGAFASTPGDGTVAISELSSFLENNLNTATVQGFMMTEGSAVKFAGFTAQKGSTLTFDWNSMFEEGGTGSLFYILNGGLTVLDIILPEGQSLPGASNSGSVTLQLLEGSNTFAFGAVSLVDLRSTRPLSIADPTLTLNNIAVNTSGIPEPGTFGLLGMGLAGLAFLARRR